MNEETLRALLARVANGQESIDQAVADLRTLPFEDVGFAKLDHHRTLRWGFPEVVFCPGKTPSPGGGHRRAPGAARPTCAGHPRHARSSIRPRRRPMPDLRYHESARALWLERDPDRPLKPGVMIVAAGTSDLPVAEEAALTLRLMGHEPTLVVDVGVAGLHRLLPHLPALQAAHVVVSVAGMEGALTSVVGGLVACPVVAVPTSVGYGASFHGLAALLAMLNSCASGVAVVNIDNGFGAGYMAALINELAYRNA
ncbi:MAG: nickel pincer cofactor biosynthesis protein LarB [Anaerolineae bacterium]